MPKTKNKITFKIAISGITAAFVIAMLAAANYSPVGKISFYFLSGLALLIPLTQGSLWACVMAFIAGGAISVAFNPIGVLPYALIFGLQITLFGVCLKFKIKPYVYLPIKGVLFVGALYLVYKFYGLASFENLFDRLGISSFPLIALILTPTYLVYDYCLKYVFGWLIRRLRKNDPFGNTPKKDANQKEENIFDFVDDSTESNKREKDDGSI